MISEVLFLVAAGGAIYAVSKRSAPSSKVARRRGIPKNSKLVKIYNNTGASPVSSSDASGATAELTGRVLGGAARRVARRWKKTRDAAGPRWERRQAGRGENVFDRWRAVREVQRQSGWRGVRPSLRPLVEAPAAAAQPAPAPPPVPAPQPRSSRPERRLHAVPDPVTSKGSTMTATVDTGTATAAGTIAPPLDWAVMIGRVSTFQPEDDAALVEFMAGEAAAVTAYAEALEQARENCVNDIGLDPSAVSGITVYSEHMSEASERLSEAHKQFMTVYGEVLALAANGVTMPHNGRWFTGATG